MSTIVKIIIGFAVLGLIALIGIFVSIYLVSSGGAREAAKDARITAEMDMIRSSAEMAFSQEDGYSKVSCDYDSELKSICNDIEDQGGKVTIQASKDEYCAYTPLNEGDYYCIDSTGVINTTTELPVSCGQGSYKCPRP